MNDKEELMQVLYDAIGEEGCGVSCEEATLFRDEGCILSFLYGS